MQPLLLAALESLEAGGETERWEHFLDALEASGQDADLIAGLERLPYASEIQQLSAWMATEIGEFGPPGTEAAVEEWTWSLVCSEWAGRLDACDLALGADVGSEASTEVARTASGFLTRTLALTRVTQRELVLAVAALLARGAFERLDARLLGAGVPVVVEGSNSSGEAVGFELGAATADGWDSAEAGYFEA